MKGEGQAFLGETGVNYIRSDGNFIDEYISGHQLAHLFGLHHDFRICGKQGEADIKSFTAEVVHEKRK